MKTKVLAYIIRKKNENFELLIHCHRDFPDAGLQVPAGTVEENEVLEAALFREIEEESGLNDVKLLQKLDHYVFTNPENNEDHDRHVFVLKAADDTKTSWDHVITGSGQDRGLVFCYSWHPVMDLPYLSGRQAESLHLLLELLEDENRAW
ncbi:NUDIX hydrolase [Peribacillus deserti]|uniref:DNA mismatch repair protein MutT n=1 Tax=Peribacillus deserti TaxID=673318 RepID=A0A2N5MAP4_9BACI|nr:NUDIX domain-containing protein [Peribacillus deserti]PLT31420.1 DNA mismatch repair protein MutT [Peribacillus deserti]